MSFLDELKQRKVFRVAVAYLGVAWLAIQAASIALPAFDAPAWSMRLVILLFALGFPVALLSSWAIELTPEGMRLNLRGAGFKPMLALTAALALLAIGWFTLGLPTLHRADGPPPSARSIAILPFANIGGDRADDYFSDGLAETTLDMLAQVPDLKVIARTSSFAFKGKSGDARKIGAALGAAHLLQGSVQRADDAVRITVQLVRADDGSQLWSQRFDRPMADVFQIQDEIATQVVKALAIALAPAAQGRLTRKRTGNVEAYQEYLRGVALMPQRKVDDLRQATFHFERAIALDPDYARAYSTASDAYHLLDIYASITASERERMHRYVDHALGLAPDLGEAHISRAERLLEKGDLPGADAEYRRGLALAPNYATGYQWYGEFLGEIQGRHDEAQAMFEQAVALDPLSPIVKNMLIYALVASGRVKPAESHLAKLKLAHPDFAQAYTTEVQLAMVRGDLLRALRAMDKHRARDPDALGRESDRCMILARFGALDEARRCLDGLAAGAAESPSVRDAQVTVAAWSGDLAGALALVARAAAVDPRLEPALLTRTGRSTEALAVYQRIAPELFAGSGAKLYPGQAADATEIGIAMLHSGASAQGRVLLQRALDVRRARPKVTDLKAREWDDVLIRVALGDHERAIAALKRGVADGYFLDLAVLDSDPLLDEFRRDPRYAATLAPARARAAAQVAAARGARLL